jgi:phage terminase large subunit-like protein
MVCDELAAWRDPDAWDQAILGLRLGLSPQAVIATTPRPTKIIKALAADPKTHLTRGKTYDNIANLAPAFVHRVISRFENTRQGRQELNAEILEDVPNALWTRAMIDRAREPVAAPDMARVVVAIDPSGARSADDKGADLIGIVVAGRGVDGRAYVLADRSCKLSPAGWGERACDAYREFHADRVIAERNFGGAMVEHVLRTTDPNVSFREVSASRGKVARGEPIAALYEQGRVSHVGELDALEDELCQLTTDGFGGGGSPDRADALIWAMHDLLLAGSSSADAWIAHYARLTKAAPPAAYDVDPLPWRFGPGARAPAPGNALTQLYLTIKAESMRSIEDASVCGRCRAAILEGAPRVTNGFEVWHLECRPN